MKFFLTQSDYKICINKHGQNSLLIIVDKNGKAETVELNNDELIALVKLAKDHTNDQTII